MKTIKAYILLFVFSGFLLSISTHFSLYVQILNGDSQVEDVNSVPEEHHENPNTKDMAKQLTSAMSLLMAQLTAESKYRVDQHFSLIENIFFDVPYSPPELA